MSGGRGGFIVSGEGVVLGVVGCVVVSGSVGAGIVLGFVCGGVVSGGVGRVIVSGDVGGGVVVGSGGIGGLDASGVVGALDGEFRSPASARLIGCGGVDCESVASGFVGDEFCVDGSRGGGGVEE